MFHRKHPHMTSDIFSLFSYPFTEVPSSDSGFRAVAIRGARGVAHLHTPYFVDIEKKSRKKVIRKILIINVPPRFLNFLRHQILASLPLMHEIKKFKSLYKHECSHECNFTLISNSCAYRSEFRYIS